jgi:hypothetical protein
MKLLLSMNMPSGGNDSHQIILNMPAVSSLGWLANYIKENEGLLLGEHLVYDRTGNGKRIWKSRGPLLVNASHVGKIAEYYEDSYDA